MTNVKLKCKILFRRLLHISFPASIRMKGSVVLYEKFVTSGGMFPPERVATFSEIVILLIIPTE